MTLNNQTDHIKPPALCKTVSYVGFFVAVVGIISNILIPLTVMKSEKLRCRSAGILMIALACTDSLYLACKIIRQVDWFEHTMCVPGSVIYGFILLVALSTSHILVVMTAINRYALICHPHTHHSVTSKKGATIQIFISAVLATCGNLFFLFSKHWQKNDTCKPNKNTNQTKSLHLGYAISTIIIFNILPYLVTTVLSVMVFRSSKKRQIKSKARPNRRAYKIEMQLTHAMISVIVAFILLSLPLLISVMINVFWGIKGAASSVGVKIKVVFCIFHLFRDVNYGINFYLYVIFCKMFRRLFINKLLHLPFGGKRDARLPPTQELVEL